LLKTKSAFSFGIHSSVQHLTADGKTVPEGDFAKVKPIPTLITTLVVGCRRRVVVYSWKDGEAQDVKVRLITPRFFGTLIAILKQGSTTTAFRKSDHFL
jgi:hypothetical protein